MTNELPQIPALQLAVNNSIAKAIEPITARVDELRTLVDKEIIKRDAINDKREDMISKLSESEVNIKQITKLRTDYDNAEDAISIYQSAIEKLGKPDVKYREIRDQMQAIIKTAMLVIQIKIDRAKLEIAGRATMLHDRQINAEYKSMDAKSKKLVATMEAMEMDAEATGHALVAVVEAVLEFMPVVTNATPGEVKEAGLDDSYMPSITNVNKQKEAAA